MGVAADCEYSKLTGGTKNATQQILTNWNTVSLLYKSTFNISLGIVEMQIQDPKYVAFPSMDAKRNQNSLTTDDWPLQLPRKRHSQPMEQCLRIGIAQRTPLALLRLARAEV